MDLFKKSIIAHRGASALVKHDNTMEAFHKAIEIGSPIMEFDIRKTKDNVLISYHDKNINNIDIKDLTCKELQELAEKKGFSVPTLEDILSISKNKIILDIELKETGYENQIITTVKKYLDYDEYFMKSFKDESIIAIKKIDSNVKTGLLLGRSPKNCTIFDILSDVFPHRRILKAKPDFIAPHYRVIKIGFIHRMKLHKLPVYVWTVNEDKKMAQLFKKGITSIITDRPDIALKYLKYE